MGRTQHRADGLELGSVPEAHIRQERAGVQRQGHTEHGDRGQSVVGRPAGLTAYHPSVTPQ